MGRKFLSVAVIGFTIALSGCAVTQNPNPTDTPAPTQTFDPALIPTTPAADALAVDAKIFDNGYGEYTFKVGGGPTWCTFNGESKFVICEQNEPDATYDPLPVPDTCKLSYGYQFKLTEGKKGEITCASGLYADPAQAQTLNPGETVTLGQLTCFVVENTVRCDNKSGNYIVLGPEVWALG